jgi:hypothetical protein
MKFTWRNRIAYLLLFAAATYYVISAPLMLQQLEHARSPETVDRYHATLSAFLGWLVGPTYIIGWAAVVEYLSRIAAALAKEPPPADSAPK